jgi:hypothetical protein
MTMTTNEVIARGIKMGCILQEGYLIHTLRSLQFFLPSTSLPTWYAEYAGEILRASLTMYAPLVPAPPMCGP